jgi:hypothetical protein
LPALAYQPQLGSGGSATIAPVEVRCGTGAPRTLAYGGASSLAWSAGGTQLAWANASGVLYVATVKAGAWSLRHWTCNCAGIAFFGDQAVSVDSQTAGGPMDQVKAVTQLLVFPSSGSGQPTTLPVTGLPTAGMVTSEFYLLGNASPADVVIGFGDPGGSDLGGTQLLFKVSSAGQATQYGHDTISAQAGPDTPFGDLGNFSVNQAGSELAFSTFSRAGGCGGDFAAYVLNTATGVITVPKTPAGVGREGWTVEGIWFDQAGTPYASLVPNTSTCLSGGFGNGQVASLTAANVVPTVVKLQDGTWVKAGSGVFRVAYGPGNWQATFTGRIASYLDAVSITVSGQAGKKSATVSTMSVTPFAWSPAT